MLCEERLPKRAGDGSRVRDMGRRCSRQAVGRVPGGPAVCPQHARWYEARGAVLVPLAPPPANPAA